MQNKRDFLKKILKFFNNQKNEIQNTLRLHFTPREYLRSKAEGTAHARADVEQWKHSSTAGGSANFYHLEINLPFSQKKMGIALP